jgi:hypothetical protein
LSAARVVCAAALMVVAAALAPGMAWPREGTPSPTATRVSYLAGGTVYIESGTLDGIAPGDTVAVLRDGAPLGRLIVRYVSSHRASCDTLGVAELPRVGDAVRFTPRAAAPDTLASGAGEAPAPAAAAAPLGTATHPRAARRLRGRVGGSWLRVDSQGAGYAQPALDVRLDAATSAADLSADVRSRHTFYTGNALDHGIGKVYRMSLSFHDGNAGRRVTLGRQTAPSLAALSLFDGVHASLGRERWSAGIFAGTQPDPVRFRISGDIVESGGYMEWRSRPRSERRWSLTSGAIASFDHGNVDREHVFVQASYADRALWASLAQEVDLYTGWKRTMGEPLISPSSTFLTARAQVTRMLTLNAGWDTRRNVRLYRDRTTPETEFDDRYRNGAWVGGAIEAAEHLRLGADARFGSGGVGGSSHTWTATGEVVRMPVLEADARLRATRFVGDLNTEWLYSGGLTVRPFGQTQLGVNAGVRTTQDVLSLIETRVAWEGADLSIGVGRSWYLMLSGERDHGDQTDDLQAYSGLSWLF